MWELYVKYAFPVMVSTIVLTSAFREFERIKKEPGPWLKAGRKRYFVLSLIVGFLLTVAVTIMTLK